MIQHRHIPINNSGTDYFVGDLHGEHSLLHQTLSRIGFDYKKDRLFAVGDLIDRGPDSASCLGLSLKPWFFSVIGNHEDIFLKSIKDPQAKQLHIKHGGQWVKPLSADEMESYADIIRCNMPLAITVETCKGSVGIIHAEAPAEWSSI
ncbi:metallophosphoesterase [Neptunomonas qingdaonensis]|uniref:Serine/threonine protein phosphatase 1 n=1 Tax=Neptunomonas qingdaonensis TaxID=1045558 RepID=A0A1I2RA48_9GAMM|nr:metallophosphoesterase [Neptunomonas qingdaonensis]SFG37564.1 serine/threonine protein phosphatase 1 [Neptunomonas qingdaonensis]